MFNSLFTKECFCILFTYHTGHVGTFILCLNLLRIFKHYKNEQVLRCSYQMLILNKWDSQESLEAGENVYKSEVHKPLAEAIPNKLKCTQAVFYTFFCLMCSKWIVTCNRGRLGTHQRVNLGTHKRVNLGTLQRVNLGTHHRASLGTTTRPVCIPTTRPAAWVPVTWLAWEPTTGLAWSHPNHSQPIKMLSFNSQYMFLSDLF